MEADYLTFEAPAVALKPLTCAGLSAQVGEIWYLHKAATGVSFTFLASLSKRLSH